MARIVIGGVDQAAEVKAVGTCNDGLVICTVVNGDTTVNLYLESKREVEEFANMLLAKYAEWMHCGETEGTGHLKCATCDVGAAHENEEGPGVKMLGAAYDAGARAMLDASPEEFAEFKKNRLEQLAKEGK